MQRKSQDDESETDPLGGLGELRIESLGLALGEEGVSAAGDGESPERLPDWNRTMTVTARAERSCRIVRAMYILFNPFGIVNTWSKQCLDTIPHHIEVFKQNFSQIQGFLKNIM